MSSIVSRVARLFSMNSLICLELQECLSPTLEMAMDRRHTFLTARTTSLDISFHVATASTKRGLRSWKAMNPRTTRVDHHPAAKHQLCVPHMFTHGHTRQLSAVLR